MASLATTSAPTAPSAPSRTRLCLGQTAGPVHEADRSTAGSDATSRMNTSASFWICAVNRGRKVGGQLLGLEGRGGVGQPLRGVGEQPVLLDQLGDRLDQIRSRPHGLAEGLCTFSRTPPKSSGTISKGN